ncbi:uncharacterized protein LOC133312724 [Gastrolobium bilobum]|uniref:uncharacterized protein LOC133312724 n=1 Tax=Gastrolobium bilobum TaxID=150636 RepID=UPI002AB202DE|nr:uncharacterized protein LOC133312724 [Gastrolobium bilobum]
MRLFPFSLAGAAKEWVEDLPAQSITTWKELGEAFLMRFFPPTKVCDLRDDITGFRQYVDESIHESWTRLKGLLEKCPTHGLPKYPEAFKTLERISQNSCQWPEQRDEAPKKAAGLYEVSEITSTAAEMASLHNTFKVLVKQMAETKQPPLAQLAAATPIFSLCYGAHLFEECSSNPSSAYYVGDYNRNYNNRGNYNQDQQRKPNGETQPLPNDQWSNRMLQNHEAMLQSHGAILKSLETQMGQIASSLSNRPVVTLPSDTEAPRR